ncbi:MAG: four helix bundle protein [Saprospiraceae bacterium]|nr:four helix bundle protein [Saprospiraceae bacterium]
MNEKENLILDLSFEFALAIISYCEELELHRKYIISKQLLRSGTSIGANVREAQSPESKADFVHKMKIAAKEANETEYWLSLCNKASSYPNCDHLFPTLTSIQKILSKIISNTKAK